MERTAFNSYLLEGMVYPPIGAIRENWKGEGTRRRNDLSTRKIGLERRVLSLFHRAMNERVKGWGDSLSIA